jgi:serine/threonine protein kinase
MEEQAHSMQRIGQQLDQYRLLRFLGTGTFGDVYLGEHITQKAMVAIKVLHMQPTAEALRDFLHDARAFRLRHPSLVPLLDFGVEANTPFLIMEYAPGGTLLQRHPQGTRVSLPQVRLYVQQIASGLHYVHEMWLLHGAVKPQNMLLGARNEVLLSDLGMVTIARSQHMLTMQEMAASMPYMAPEQLQGQPGPASDQYSLGMIVYEWLSGEHPFPGAPWEVSLLSRKTHRRVSQICSPSLQPSHKPVNRALPQPANIEAHPNRKWSPENRCICLLHPGLRRNHFIALDSPIFHCIQPQQIVLSHPPARSLQQRLP